MTIINPEEPARHFMQVPPILDVLQVEYERTKVQIEAARFRADTVIWIVPFFLEEMNEGLEFTVSGYTVDEAYEQIIRQLRQVLFTPSVPGVRRITRLREGVR